MPTSIPLPEIEVDDQNDALSPIQPSDFDDDDDDDTISDDYDDDDDDIIDDDDDDDPE
jgi:hypothetical protein